MTTTSMTLIGKESRWAAEVPVVSFLGRVPLPPVLGGSTLVHTDGGGGDSAVPRDALGSGAWACGCLGTGQGVGGGSVRRLGESEAESQHPQAWPRRAPGDSEVPAGGGPSAPAPASVGRVRRPLDTVPSLTAAPASWLRAERADWGVTWR